jgi:non-ribosomal peptide synthetase component F
MSNTDQLEFCTGIVAANRSQYELQNLIGFFVNTIPFFIKINPYESFIEFCHRIQQIWLETFQYSNLPYQEIVKLNSNLRSSFLQRLFLIETRIDDNEQNIQIDQDNTLNIIDRRLLTGNIAKFDMICMLYEHRRNETISVTLNASLDLYDESTISIMANRLEKIFHQLFSTSSINQFSILLSNEHQIIHELNNNFIDYDPTNCIHWEFARQAHLQPQKVALSLRNGSITYNELLYYTQYLSNYLKTNYDVQPGEIIYQLMERSFEMIIGMISIWMNGAIYTPLSPYEPSTHLNECIQQTKTSLIFVHQSTHKQSLSKCLLIDVDRILNFNEKIFSRINSVQVTTEDISHITFTKDSSLLLKAVSIE